MRIDPLRLQDIYGHAGVLALERAVLQIRSTGDVKAVQLHGAAWFPRWMSMSKADIEAAVQNSFLSAIDQHLVQELLETSLPLDLAAGAILYPEEGDPRMALVIRGLLRVYLTSAEGRQITVRYARDGDVLGTAVVVAGPVRTPVQAVTDTTVLLLNAEHVRGIARSDRRIAWAFAEEVTRRLYDVLDELAGTAFSSVKARVARHLLDLGVREAESGRWVVTATQQDIADAVGSVREVVARVLRQLRDEHLIDSDGHRTTIADPARLHDASRM